MGGLVTVHFAFIVALEYPVDSPSALAELNILRVSFVGGAFGPCWASLPIANKREMWSTRSDLAVSLVFVIV